MFVFLQIFDSGSERETNELVEVDSGTPDRWSSLASTQVSIGAEKGFLFFCEEMVCRSGHLDICGSVARCAIFRQIGLFFIWLTVKICD